MTMAKEVFNLEVELATGSGRDIEAWFYLESFGIGMSIENH